MEGPKMCFVQENSTMKADMWRSCQTWIFKMLHKDWRITPEQKILRTYSGELCGHSSLPMDNTILIHGYQYQHYKFRYFRFVTSCVGYIGFLHISSRFIPQLVRYIQILLYVVCSPFSCGCDVIKCDIYLRRYLNKNASSFLRLYACSLIFFVVFHL